MGSANLLGSFPIARTSNAEEMRASFARVYGRPVMEFAGRDRTLHTVINHCKLQDIELNYATYGGNLHLHFPETEFVSQIFQIRGKGEAFVEGHSVQIDRHQSAVVTSDTCFSLNTDVEYERLVLCMRSDSLTRTLSTLTGVTITAPVKVNPAQRLTDLSERLLRDQLMFFVGQLNTAASIPPMLLSEFEQALVVAFLHVNRHNYSHLLERRTPEVAPKEVRRAEEYIEANWRRAITLEDLVAVAGVDALGLFRSFKKYRGYSPMQFLERMRDNNRDFWRG